MKKAPNWGIPQFGNTTQNTAQRPIYAIIAMNNSENTNLGLGCPSCEATGTSGDVWRVLRTHNRVGQIQRDRECRHCGFKATTTERFLNIPSPKTNQNDTRINEITESINQILGKYKIDLASPSLD